MLTTTFRNHGQRLPLGKLLPSGELSNNFILRAHTAATDRMLNTWREANIGEHVGMEVAKYLSLIIESAMGEAYALLPDGNSPPESAIRLLDWNFGDVMYVYIYARILAVEEWMSVGYACHGCGSVKSVDADLFDTEVTVAESPEDLHAWVTFKKGFKLDTGKTCMKLQLKSTPFRSMTLPGGSAEGVDSLGFNQLRESIVAVHGAAGGYLPTDIELERIGKLDMLRIDRQAGVLAAGPKLRTHLTCDNVPAHKQAVCGTKIFNALDWRYDSFFDSSVPLHRLLN